MTGNSVKTVPRTIFSIILFMLLPMLLLLSCATRNPEISSPGAKTTTGPEPIAKPDWQIEWDKMLQAARKEGKVAVYSSQGSDVRKALIGSFQDKFGIPMDMVVLPGGQTSDKIVREQKAGIYLADAIIGGNTPFVTLLKPAGALVPPEPQLVLPEVKDKALWWSGGLHFIDQDHSVIAFSAYNVPVIAYNTNLVKAQEVKTYMDLLDPKWRGKIVIADPTQPGTTPKWMGVIVSSKLGADYLRQLARQEPVVIRDQRLQVEWLARGKYPLAVVPKPEVYEEFLKAGAPLDIKNTEDGIPYLSTGGGNLALIRNAPHPNAAKLFINWLLSKEGGIVFQQANGRPSGRVDVPKDQMNPLTLLPSGVKGIPAETEEFLLQETQRYSLFKEIFGSSVQ